MLFSKKKTYQAHSTFSDKRDSKVILGIDPGLATTGFGIINNDRGKLSLIDYGCITTKAGVPRAQRLKQISEELTKLIIKQKIGRAHV